MTRLPKKPTPDADEEAAPILVPKGIGEFTFGDHLRHLHEHAGDIPATLDEFVAAGSSWTLDRGGRSPKQQPAYA
jgi:hypothetical protein